MKSKESGGSAKKPYFSMIIAGYMAMRRALTAYMPYS